MDDHQKPAGKTDSRGRLQEKPFACQALKDGSVLIYWQNRLVTRLGQKQGQKFLQAMQTADEEGAQLLMARATGHFKHGNERR